MRNGASPTLYTLNFHLHSIYIQSNENHNEPETQGEAAQRVLHQPHTRRDPSISLSSRSKGDNAFPKPKQSVLYRVWVEVPDGSAVWQKIITICAIGTAPSIINTNRSIFFSMGTQCSVCIKTTSNNNIPRIGRISRRANDMISDSITVSPVNGLMEAEEADRVLVN